MNANTLEAHSDDDPQQFPLSRRQVLRLGGVAAGVAATTAIAPTSALGQPRDPSVTLEDLGPGVVHYAAVASLLVGDTMYVGSRNLEPSRVVAYHVPTGTATETHMLGNGDFVSGLAADGEDILYAGVTRAADTTNLYRVYLPTGEVSGIAAVPGLFIRDLAVAPDGILYIVGRPVPFAAGPPIYSYDPATGDLSMLAIPDPNCDQIVAVDVTDTTVYVGCDSRLTGRTGNGLYAVDRASGATTKIRDGVIRTFAVEALGDVVAVGSQPSREDWFAVLDVPTGTWREFDLPEAKAAGLKDGGLIVLSGHEIQRIDLETWQMTHLGTTARGSSTRLGLFDNLIIGTGGSAGFVWIYDFDTGQTEIIDLAGAGAQGDPQLGMSVAAGSGFAYVGGTGVVGVHDLTDQTSTNIRVGTEAKDMIVVDGVAYLAVYSGIGLWEHRAADGTPPEHVADFPDRQNRPQVVRWEPENELVMVGLKADTTSGGSLCFYDPATRSLSAHINPLGDSQYVGAGAVGGGLVYIGGSRDSSAPTQGGDLAAWDPATGKEVWRLANPLGQNIASLVIHGNSLFGITVSNTFFVVRLATNPRLAHTADFDAVTSRDASLVIDRGCIYGASARSLFRVDPVSYQPRVLVDGLDGEWFGRSRLAVDEDHWLYTLRGRDLVRVQDRTTR